MKKYFLNVGFLCLCAGFVFVGCNKDDDDLETSVVADNKITATVSAPNVAVVKALIDDHSDNGTGPTVAECDYSNGGFTLTLPATVDAGYLATFSDIESGISISDKNVKVATLRIAGYDADGAMAGRFYYESETRNTDYMYVDRNVTITGSYTDEDDDTYIYNISLVKGWNIVYMIETENDDVYTWTYTTSNPGGLSWSFYGSSVVDVPETSVVADNKITATVSAPNVAVVKALAYGYEHATVTIAECDYSNGGFTLTLPETLDAEYIRAMKSEIPVSDRDVKVGSIEIAGYNAEGVRTGTFKYGSNTCDIEYTYADRNFTATGSYTDTESGNKFVYNAFLVRGWNILYVIATEKDGVRTYTLTTSNPGGLSWSFE